MSDIYTLGIESSCDETAAAVIKNGRFVLSNVVNTQIDIHTQYGGVVPEIASRNHIKNISNVVNEALKQANISLNDIDVIYKKMLDEGATTFFETELGPYDFNGAGSMCHGWSALPIYYYHLFKIGK